MFISKILIPTTIILLMVTGISAQDQCKPIGWATKNGRTGGNVAVTGGGNATPITVTNYADLEKYATDGSPRVIYIDGTLGSGWSGKSGSRLSIKSNKTIVGIRPGTLLKAAIQINGASNIILRNIVIKGPGSDGAQAWDNIVVEGASKNIWIDHCEFWDGQDGNSDAVKGADNITYTWNIFGYTKAGPHNFSNLIASSDNEPVSVGKLNITFMHNWFRGINQRGPRCRYGNVHVVNNLYTKDGLPSSYCVSAGFDCQVITENNAFIGMSTPISTSHKGGTSAHYVTGNLFSGTSGNQTGYGSAFNVPYEYKSYMLPASQVESVVKARAGAILASPSACNNTTPTSSVVVSSSSAIIPSSSSVAVSSSSIIRPSSSSVIVSSSSIIRPSSSSVVAVSSSATVSVAFKIPALSFCTASGVSETKNAGFEQSAYLNINNQIGAAATYSVQASAALQSQLIVRYANGGTAARGMTVALNGSTVGSIPFATTGAWTTWQTGSLPINLAQGQNNLTLTSTTAEGGPNMDWLGFTGNGLSTANCEPVVKLTGVTSLQGTRVNVHGRTLLIGLERGIPATVRVYNINGKKILDIKQQGQDGAYAMDPGLYIVKVQSENSSLLESVIQVHK